MKFATLAAVAVSVFASGAIAQDAEDPFADAVETRHGLMLQIQADVAREPGVEADFARKDYRVGGNEQDVIERQGFLNHAHGDIRKSRIIRVAPGAVNQGSALDGQCRAIH